MSYTPNFLINVESLNKAIEDDELYIYNMDEKGTAENILDAQHSEVCIRGINFYFISTEFSSEGKALKDYLDDKEVEYYEFLD